MFGKGLKRQPAMAYPQITKEEAVAIKCVYKGNAVESQQKLAMDCIIKKFCNIGGLEFDPESERISAFMGGKRTVGAQLVFTINEPIEKVIAEIKKQER